MPTPNRLACHELWSCGVAASGNFCRVLPEGLAGPRPRTDEGARPGVPRKGGPAPRRGARGLRYNLGSQDRTERDHGLAAVLRARCHSAASSP